MKSLLIAIVFVECFAFCNAWSLRQGSDSIVYTQGLDVGGKHISHVAAPLEHHQATTKAYVDATQSTGTVTSCATACPGVDLEASSFSCNASSLVVGECMVCTIFARNAGLQPTADSALPNWFQVMLTHTTTGTTFLPPESIQFVSGPGYPSLVATVCPSELGIHNITVDFYGIPLSNDGIVPIVAVTGSTELDTGSFDLLCEELTISRFVRCVMGASDVHGQPASPNTPFDVQLLYEGSAIPENITPIPSPSNVLGGAWIIEHAIVLQKVWVDLQVFYNGSMLDHHNFSVPQDMDCIDWLAQLDISQDLGPALFGTGATSNFVGTQILPADVDHILDATDFAADEGQCGWGSWQNHCGALEGGTRAYQVDFPTPVVLKGFGVQGYCSSGDPLLYGPSGNWVILGAPTETGPWRTLGLYAESEFTRFPTPFQGYPSTETKCFAEAAKVKSVRIQSVDGTSYTHATYFILCTLNLYSLS